MGNDAPDGATDLRRPHGVALDQRDLPPHPFVEGDAHGRSVGPDRVQLVIHGGDHALGDAGTDRPAQNLATLFAHPLPDATAQIIFLAGQHPTQLAQDEGEDLLVAATLDQAVERAGDHAPGGRAADDARQKALDQTPGAPILQRGEDARQARRQRLGRRAGTVAGSDRKRFSKPGQIGLRPARAKPPPA